MAKRKERKPKVEPKWRTVEKVAALVERALDPGATVTHDVRLPDLVTPDAEARQCDVVVTTGPEHRRTTSIVEVQRRNKKVGPEHLANWLDKMRVVGAQHLICVSAAGYTSSAIAKAAQLGPTVRLCLFRELTEQADILNGIADASFLRTSTIDAVDDIELLGRAARQGNFRGEINRDAQLFERANGAALTLNEIVRHVVNREAHRLGLRSGVHELRMAVNETLKFTFEGESLSVQPRFRVKITVEVARLLHEIHEYHQLPEAGPHHWVLTARTPSTADEQHEFRMFFGPGPDGRLRPGAIDVTGLTEDSAFSVNVGGVDSGAVLVRRAADGAANNAPSPVKWEA